jgi:hypothetical protein
LLVFDVAGVGEASSLFSLGRNKARTLRLHRGADLPF